MNELVEKNKFDLALESAQNYILSGDIASLNPGQQKEFCVGLAHSLGLNPLTRPFDFIPLQGKMTLYANKDAAEQLRHKHRISVSIIDRKFENGMFSIVAKATALDGRTDESIAVIPAEGAKGEKLANLMMKCETKAKRRVTLSVCGLGIMDESEVKDLLHADKLERPSVGRPTQVISSIPTTTTIKEKQTEINGGGNPKHESTGVIKAFEAYGVDEKMIMNKFNRDDINLTPKEIAQSEAMLTALKNGAAKEKMFK